MSENETDAGNARANIRAAAIRAALGKLEEVVTEFHAAKQQEAHAKALLNAAQARETLALDTHTQLIAMAHMFEFDLDKEYAAWVARQGALPNPEPAAIAQEPATAAMAAAIAGADRQKLTIKDQVIAAAGTAYPSPVRASAIRKQLEAAGLSVHEKTIGMTLYRLSKDGILRRSGRDWFFMPEDQRQTAGLQGEESPGNEPGLLLAAE